MTPQRCTNPTCLEHWPPVEDPQPVDLLARLSDSLKRARRTQRAKVDQ